MRTQLVLTGADPGALLRIICSGYSGWRRALEAAGRERVRHDHGLQEEGSYMYWHGPHAGGWAWAVGLGSLLFWVLFAVAIAALVRSFLRGGRGPYPPFRGYGTPGPYDPPEARAGHGPVTPEQILAERYARGEIDEDEFWRRMTTLRSGRQGDTSAGPALRNRRP